MLADLLSAIPYIIASFSFGWEIVLPVYFALHIYMSGQQAFYHPSPRAIDPWAAKALPLTLLAAYIPIIAQGATMLGQKTGETVPVHAGWILPAAHASIPLLLHAGKRFYQNGAPQLSVGQLLFGTRDLKYVSRFFGIMFLISSTAHLLLVSMILPELGSDTRSFMIAPSLGLMQIGCLALTVMIWCTFVVWDMRRVNLTQASLSLTLLGTLIGSLILGPAAVLAGFWKWRETVLEKGRQRK